MNSIVEETSQNINAEINIYETMLKNANLLNEFKNQQIFDNNTRLKEMRLLIEQRKIQEDQLCEYLRVKILKESEVKNLVLKIEKKQLELENHHTELEVLLKLKEKKEEELKNNLLLSKLGERQKDEVIRLKEEIKCMGENYRIVQEKIENIANELKEIQQLTVHINSKNNAVIDLEFKIEECNKEIDDVNLEMDKKNENIHEILEEIKALEFDIQNIMEIITGNFKSVDVEQEKNEYKRKIELNMPLKKNAQELLDKVQQAYEKLEIDKLALNKENKDCEKKKSYKMHQIKEIDKEIALTHEQRQQLQIIEKNLIEDFQTIKETSNKKKKELETKQREYDICNKDIIQEKGIIIQKEIEIKTNEKDKNRITKELNENIISLNKTENDLAVIELQLTQQNSELEQSRKNIEKYKVRIQNEENRIKEIEKEKCSTFKSITAFGFKTAALTAQLIAAKAAAAFSFGASLTLVAALVAQITMLGYNLIQEQRKQTEIEIEMIDINNRLKKYKNDQNQLEKKLESLENKAQISFAKKKTLLENRTAYGGKIKFLELEKQTLEGKIKDLKENVNQSKQKMINEISNKLKIENESILLKAEVEEFDMHCQDQEKELKEISQILKDKFNELTKIQNEKEKLNGTLPKFGRMDSLELKTSSNAERLNYISIQKKNTEGILKQYEQIINGMVLKSKFVDKEIDQLKDIITSKEKEIKLKNLEVKEINKIKEDLFSVMENKIGIAVLNKKKLEELYNDRDIQSKYYVTSMGKLLAKQTEVKILQTKLKFNNGIRNKFSNVTKEIEDNYINVKATLDNERERIKKEINNIQVQQENISIEKIQSQLKDLRDKVINNNSLISVNKLIDKRKNKIEKISERYESHNIHIQNKDKYYIDFVKNMRDSVNSKEVREYFIRENIRSMEEHRNSNFKLKENERNIQNRSGTNNINRIKKKVYRIKNDK